MLAQEISQSKPSTETTLLATAAQSIRKRDGETLQTFDPTKLKDALNRAWQEAKGTVDQRILNKVLNTVLDSFVDDTVDVEQVQDAVETALMRHKQFEVAKTYILYRHKRTEARQARVVPDTRAIADYVALSKYSQYIPELNRRETYLESVSRVEAMHIRRFPDQADQTRWAFGFVRAKKVLPSMRTLQFGGKAVEAVHCRAFNCCATLVDRPRAFAELFYLLLCGSGTGFSCQFEHIDKLPPMAYVDENNVIHHSVADSIEGWSNALDTLILGHLCGYYVEFDYSPIRPRGAPLRTAGGKAPGHLGLKRTLEKVRKVLTGSAGRKLRPIEAYDIVCHTADAVLSGGVRRSATICMFSLDDSEMLNAKTGDWYITHPWRANSNNSAVLLRGEATSRQFKRVFEMVKQWGEPGFIFSHDINYMYNPCVEAALYPLLKITESNLDEARRRIGPQVNAGDTFTGFSFCNLTSVNAAAVKTVEEFQEAAKAATFIGTLQASYTKMPYLGAVSEMLAERDALLGVSMTGMLDNPLVACDPKVQRDTAEKIVAWNREFAAQLGIKSAARTTCIKPEGTGSLALGAVAPGHHAHHSRRYIRRIIAKDNDPIFLFLRSKNPQMCLRKPNGDWVVEFPIEAPQGATLKEDLTAINFLEKIRSTQQNWVVPGTARSEDAPGLTHNVSNTVQVKDDEWEPVADYLWAHQNDFAAVSLLPVLADKQYSFAPYEAVTTPEDEIRWNQILSKYVAVDYTEMVEKDDMTDLQGEAACAGGACLL